MKNDTICAISTPLGRGGIGIVRLSGPATYPFLERIFRDKKGKPVKLSRLPSHTVKYGFIREGTQTRDEVLLTVMKGPRSYTREDMAEIGCHGGLVPLKGVLRALISVGCRLAEPGEFTRRAFLSGRIDLTQAEAVLAAVNSRTETGFSAALNQLQGRLSRALAELEENVLSFLAEIEAEIEFPEDGLPKSSGSSYRKRISGICRKAEEFIAGAEEGKILEEGLKVAILGRPNVGKSSLLNILLAEDRAIVTDIPGTTRDEISEMVNVSGWPLKIIDTAGIRQPKDKIEEAGVSRSRTWMKAADLILLVLDRSKPLQPEDKKLLAEVNLEKTILVINKTDLPNKLFPSPLSSPQGGEARIKEKLPSTLRGEGGVGWEFTRVEISALKGHGIKKLEKTIAGFISEGKVFSGGGNPVFLALEQETALKNAFADLQKTAVALKERLPLEFVAADLKRAVGYLGRLSGRQISEEVLDQIFSRFCLGK
ncbi:MAG: tRNA uridine-5-carboxymethylaminomethyl(34) synthesis GTPase MnmE [Candidatus Ratteibacteria bacterium]|jgi:tRNA modification GTPase